MLGVDVPGVDDDVPGVDDDVLGVDDAVLGVLGGGKAMLTFFFFFFCLSVSLVAGLNLTSVGPYGAFEQSIRSSSSTSTGASPELVVIGSGGVSLTSQEHFPSSSMRLQAPITSPLSWLPWGERRISHSLVGDSISGYLSCPWGVNMGPVMLATVAITSANLLAIPM